VIELGVAIGLLAVILIVGALVYYDDAKMRRDSAEYYRKHLQRDDELKRQ